MRGRGIFVSAVFWLALAVRATAQSRAKDLSDVSLEDLMNIEVTTVSKKEQKLSQAPAAIFVITQEDIRRSGMTSIPDLLRMVPGLDVAQIQGGPWAVSARGFNQQYSNKLLVLVDGRSVYDPMTGGVSWEEQGMPIEDIERIEVIRGPGATLWGSDAVNGVINIITKPAKETQGALATVGGGGQGQALATFRYGGQLGDSGYYRAFAKYEDGRGLSNSQGQSVIGGESSITAGFRADWALGAADSLTAEAGIIRAHAKSEVESFALLPPFGIVSSGTEHNSQGDLMLNWTHRQSAASETQVRVYFDHAATTEPNIGRSFSTFDIDFQHRLTLSESNDLIYGLGFRDSSSNYAGGFSANVTPAHRNDPLFSGFLQDQVNLAAGRVSFIFGSKLEHNNFTGVEIQPGVRFLWILDHHQTLWASVSRAVRTPANTDYGLELNFTSAGPGGVPLAVRLSGSPATRSEDLLAYELGYRLQAGRRFSVDLASFYNVYHHLETYEAAAPFLEQDPSPAHLVIPFVEANLMHGNTYGVEIASTWNLTERWRLMPSYSWLRLDLRLDPDSTDTVNFALNQQNPEQQFQIRSNFDITRALQFDAAAYHVGAFPTVAAYTRLDARLGYRLRSDLEISAIGQNLQGGQHAEYITLGPYTRATIGRSFFVKLTWGF